MIIEGYYGDPAENAHKHRFMPERNKQIKKFDIDNKAKVPRAIPLLWF